MVKCLKNQCKCLRLVEQYDHGHILICSKMWLQVQFSKIRLNLLENFKILNKLHALKKKFYNFFKLSVLMMLLPKNGYIYLESLNRKSVQISWFQNLVMEGFIPLQSMYLTEPSVTQTLSKIFFLTMCFVIAWWCNSCKCVYLFSKHLFHWTS